jgi:tetratricopeptide (TPR) repeat protein
MQPHAGAGATATPVMLHAHLIATEPPTAMTDNRAAAHSAAEAYELWQADLLDEAAAKYRTALALASEDAVALADYHTEFAAVLEAQGEPLAAEQQLEAALAVELARAADATDVGVTTARYFLAEFLVRHGQAQRALGVVQPHLGQPLHGVWLLHLVAAEAWVALGDIESAEGAAREALRTAPAEERRTELRLRFLDIGLYDAGIHI